MAVIEERVAFLEARVSEHGQMINGIRQAIVSLEARMDQRFAAIDQRFVAIDQRFAGVDQRFLGIDQRLAALDDKMSSQFHWVVGLQVTTFVATIATVLAALLAR